ncbi:hypothetical protein [Hymenobacter arizonensis]|uniref:hypothetical protein n=1 Tax=Hymenobacter arizonensis TaxID=1227077 RepID=UPI0011604CF1|nr:hypothetical protein [Hymenobacter arizonensis]
MGSQEVARDPEVRALRAGNKRLAQELDMLNTALASACLMRRLAQPTPVSTYQHIARQAARVPVRQRCQVLRVALAAY